MKKCIQNLLQKMLGCENYLYCFARFKISFLGANTYEAELFEFIKLIPQGSILNIGANIRLTTVPPAKKFPLAAVHAFEPIPANVNTLKRIIQHYKLSNVQVHEVALGEAPGELKLVLSIIGNVRRQGLAQAYVEDRTHGWNTGDMYNIPLMKLDEIPVLKQIGKIAAIKVDMENYEYYLFKGGEQLLKQHKPIFYCELWDNEMRMLVISFLNGLG